MFKKFQDQMKQMQMLQKMMKDENFRTLVSHPKVQALMQDTEFQRVVQTRDPKKIANFPKLVALRNDPDLAAILSKFKPEEFLKGIA